MRYFLIPVLVSIALAALSCANRDQARFVQEAGRTMQGFRQVTYHRASGMAGPDDRVTIAADGAAQVGGRILGDHAGRLSDFQMMQLVRLFDGWDQLADGYPPVAAANVASTEISWGEKTVKVTDGAAGVPEQFLRIRERLETIARELPAAQSKPAM